MMRLAFVAAMVLGGCAGGGIPARADDASIVGCKYVRTGPDSNYSAESIDFGCTLVEQSGNLMVSAKIGYPLNVEIFSMPQPGGSVSIEETDFRLGGFPCSRWTGSVDWSPGDSWVLDIVGRCADGGQFMGVRLSAVTK